MALFGGKWKSRILCVLAGQGTLRYSALRKQMGNITDAVLAAALKELLADDMIQRRSYDEIPPGWNTPFRKKAALLSRFCRASANGPAAIIKKRKRTP